MLDWIKTKWYGLKASIWEALYQAVLKVSLLLVWLRNKF